MLAMTWTLALRGQASDASGKLSPTFSQAAMGALADIYRWRENAQAAAKSDVTPNLPPPGRPMKSLAYEHLRQAQMSATTQGDQQAGDMLQKHFSDVDAWVGKLIEARKNMDATNAVDPNSVDQDPDLVRITTCEKAFNAMLEKGTFAPIAECQ
jgi:hypothetical protein